MEVDQDQLENGKGSQVDEEVVLSTSSYESLDSIDKEALRIPHLRKHNIKELDKKLHESALGAYLFGKKSSL